MERLTWQLLQTIGIIYIKQSQTVCNQIAESAMKFPFVTFQWIQWMSEKKRKVVETTLTAVAAHQSRPSIAIWVPSYTIFVTTESSTYSRIEIAIAEFDDRELVVAIYLDFFSSFKNQIRDPMNHRPSLFCHCMVYAHKSAPTTIVSASAPSTNWIKTFHYKWSTTTGYWIVHSCTVY